MRICLSVARPWPSLSTPTSRCKRTHPRALALGSSPSSCPSLQLPRCRTGRFSLPRMSGMSSSRILPSLRRMALGYCPRSQRLPKRHHRRRRRHLHRLQVSSRRIQVYLRRNLWSRASTRSRQLFLLRRISLDSAVAAAAERRARQEKETPEAFPAVRDFSDKPNRSLQAKVRGGFGARVHEGPDPELREPAAGYGAPRQ